MKERSEWPSAFGISFFTDYFPDNVKLKQKKV